MKNSRRNNLLAALLVCLAPAAASAAEGYLTPSTNNGSGNMPSGYSTLYFELSDTDWVPKLALPKQPKQGDMVILSSLSSKYATLSSARTAFAAQSYIPVENLSNIVLRWSDSHQRWDVNNGESSRVVYGQRKDTLEVPMSDHLVTQVGLYDTTKWANQVKLPAWAPQGAVLVVANSTSNDVQVGGDAVANGATSTCESRQNCSFVFGADGKWDVREGNVRVKPAAQLQAPVARWNHVLLGNPAVDVDMQPTMRLPAEGNEGDVFQIANVYGAKFTEVLPDNTNMAGGTYVPKGIPLVLRYDAAQRRWMQQPIR
ncbi:hypothetical protein [Stenotrophomonas maltophilia]|uniref:hypothetical protein n=1 Tax=Stenotrophomonas maltophilia TaxID=40324 RepID=UPI000C267DF6|nr:hypothetical protein [Stenotrophomonas maltophilia]PJL58868.1 hypothetical protein B9Y82_09040 [Stenotrophomonas maltophilia]